jgi:hypothetical protein
MKKTSKQQIWLGIEAFLENNLLLFHTPSKLNVLQWIILDVLLCSPKNDHLKIVLWSIQIQIVMKTM